MKLRTLVNILLSTHVRVELFWKEREGLLNEINSIHSSFVGSDDLLNSPDIITDYILNIMSDRIQIYKKRKIEEFNVIKEYYNNSKMNYPPPKEDKQHFQELSRIISRKNDEEEKKDGSFFLELNNDELYELFSLEEWRQKQINRII